MNAEDREVMTQIEKDIAEIKTALLGSPLSGDRGLVGRISTLEERIRTLETEKTKNTIYVKIITWLASIIGVGFVGLIFNYFKK